MTAVDIDWGERGLARLLVRVDAVAIVDVLSFSACVAVACRPRHHNPSGGDRPRRR